ncbi:putative transcription factor interactor and regulator CCHC(Zn) family [Helianthus annuus]|nr:putative transcription factor interactor and regulator CCHC(Zn) family [Helianthus annuus]
MTEKFCPRHEIKKLEDEFWVLEQDSGDNVAYNKRFHELSKMCPYLFTPLTRLIEQYIKGLPPVIKDTVEGSKPETLEVAMRLAGQLTENRIKSKHLNRNGVKGSTSEAEEPKEARETRIESPSRSNKKKHRDNGKNYAVTTPNKKPYTGSFPKCNYCQYHHPPNFPCRQCTGCGRFGHLVDACRNLQNQTTNQPRNPHNAQVLTQPFPQPNLVMVPYQAQNVTQPYYQHNYPMMPHARACFNCGDPTHFRNSCPRLVNIINAQAQAHPINQANQAAGGRAFNVNVNQAGANNDAGNV